MKIILASHNANKVREIKSILKDHDIVSLADLGFKDDIEENGKTFEENAYIKAKYIYDIYKLPVIADDSGLCVDVLDGAPGVYSHRYASELCDDSLNNALLMKNMEGKENRKAHFTCAICYYDGKTTLYAVGICNGEIATSPKGENGFGYDPYFYIPSLNKNMAELSMEEKNKISHRRRALENLEVILDEHLNYIG